MPAARAFGLRARRGGDALLTRRQRAGPFLNTNTNAIIECSDIVFVRLLHHNFGLQR
jgi:hypothetical protein